MDWNWEFCNFRRLGLGGWLANERAGCDGWALMARTLDLACANSMGAES